MPKWDNKQTTVTKIHNFKFMMVDKCHIGKH